MTQKLGSLFIDGEGSANDKSGNNHVVTNYNVNIDTEVKRFDQSSLYFNNALLWVPSSSSFSFDSDFTIDFWANLTGQDSYTTPITTSSDGNGTGGWWLQLGQGNGFWFLYDYRGPNQIIFADAALFEAFGNLTNQGWFHFALVRSNGIISVYKNGVLISSISYSANIVSTNQLIVGTLNGAGSANLNGNMDNIRLVKGEALWTSNFELTEEALFYKDTVIPPVNPYVRPDSVKGLYAITKKAGIRNAAKNGFIRPTLSEMFMTHRDFVEVISFVGPSTIGEFFQGGYYAGNIVVNTKTYAIMVSHANNGQVNLPCRSDGNIFTPNTDSEVDGFANTQAMMTANPTVHEAGAFCWNLTLNGYSDWYMPSKNEMLLVLANKDLLEPVAGSLSGTILGGWYWTSTTLSDIPTANVVVLPGSPGYQSKTYHHYVRAVRRVEL